MILLTYSFEKHGFSGHIFEVLDYFYWLTVNGFTNIYFAIPFFTFDDILRIVSSRYTKKFYDFIYNQRNRYVYIDKTYVSKPVIDLTKFSIVISTNGGLCYNRHKRVFLQNFVGFRCNIEKDTSLYVIGFRYILQDSRIYVSDWSDFQTIDYIKKILFDSIKYEPCDNVYEYAAYCQGTQKDICHKFVDIINDSCLIIGRTQKPPIDNLFAKFKTYLVTPTRRKFDCSPRLIKECQYFDKEILFLNQPDYSTYIRYKDPLDKVDLKNDEFILEFLEKITC